MEIFSCYDEDEKFVKIDFCIWQQGLDHGYLKLQQTSRSKNPKKKYSNYRKTGKR